MFDLVNIFDVFLPQLLLYPNPKDPLNGEAASKFINDETRYKEIVKDYVKRYANEDSVDIQYKQLTKKNQTVTEETKTEAIAANRRKQKENRKAIIQGDDDEEHSELSETSQLDIVEDEDDGDAVECDDKQREDSV